MLRRLPILLLFCLALTACSREAESPTRSAGSPEESAPAPQATAGAEHFLVFFLDPDGGPCRMQGEILSRMGSELSERVRIRPVRTTVAEDREIFYAYGIRALPTLLLADASGREIDRLPPGVHQAARIRQLLSRIEDN